MKIYFGEASRAKAHDVATHFSRGQIAFTSGRRTVLVIRPEDMIEFACAILGQSPPAVLAANDNLAKYIKIIGVANEEQASGN